jgi:hypothetical protein
MATGRNLLSMLAIISLAIGTFCIVLLIFEQTRVIEKLEYEEWYKVGAAIANIFVVFFLSYIILTSGSRSAAYKVFMVIVLVAGFIAELVLTNIFSNLSPQYPVYIVLVFNFLVRLYITIQLIQEPWDVMTLTSGKTISATAPSLPAVVQKTLGPSAVEKAMDDDAENFRNQFKAIYRQARQKVGNDNFDDSAINKAYREVIDPAVAVRDFSKDRLKDAAAYLKDKSGNPIKDLTFGGKKRR